MAGKIYIIDGSAYIYRAYHALVPLTNSKGQPTHAVYGFINMFKRLFREKSPERLLVVWDSKGKVFRHEMYEKYKANRPPMPDDLVSQLPFIKKYVEAAEFPSLEMSGVEADDIIGTAALGFKEKGFDVIIVSGDKDLLQLVDDNITMWDPMKGKEMGAKEVVEKYQVGPDVLLDYFALMGDSADNVPGVPGVGPKTARKLIREYGSLDSLYENISSMKKSKMKNNLSENREMALLSRELIRLKTDVDINLDPDHYKVGEGDKEALTILYHELGFTSLLKDVETLERVPVEGFKLVNSPQLLDEVVTELAKAELFAVDTETTSLDGRKAELVGISLAVDLERAWYIPLGHKDDRGERVDHQLDVHTVLELLTPFLHSTSKIKLGHNLKYDYTVFRNYDIALAEPLVDSLLAAYLIDPSRRSLKLDDLCRDFGVELTSFTEVVEGDKREDCFAYVSPEKACNYSCEDVYGALFLWKEYEKELADLDLGPLFHDIEIPLIPVLAEMERAGIGVDRNRLATLKEEFSEKLVALQKEIYEQAGREFNINSPSQLGSILFEELGLPHGRKTKTGYSTDIRVLEKLSARHELPRLVIQFRNTTKLLSTYVEKLAELIDSSSNRVHSSFNQAVTATGRLSSSNPNMQNIPIRTDDGMRIRAAFVPQDGKMFLSADYSQIDLRVMAHYSGDKGFVHAFRSGADIHARTAAQIFGVSEMLITPEMRRVAKSINFGIVYGMSAFGLSKQLEISRKEAQKFIDCYFDHYSGVKKFMDEIIEQAKSDGYVTTLLNRRRILPDINASNKNRREFAERAAINTPIQGSAADIIKLAMLKVYEALRKGKFEAKMLLQVHDELIFELPREELRDVSDLVQAEMEQALVLDVPLVVNLVEGESLAK